MRNNKGIALMIVLFVLMIVIILANVMLALTSSESRLTHHQVSRVQANYAAMAGINYAFEALRIGDANWPIPASGTSYTRRICRSGCSAPDINDNSFPPSIQSITITVAGRSAADPPGVDARISAAIDYTYTP